MRIRDIDTFFQRLNDKLDFPIDVLLTGGAAAVLYGIDRATYDIDFEIHLAGSKDNPEAWPTIQKSLQDVAASTGITPQYAEDIDRWSSIVLPQKKSTLYKKIGRINVRILNPDLWAIGKLTRFISSDISDLLVVLKSQKTDAKKCVRLWGRALGMSPPSSSQTIFSRQVERFLQEHAKIIWGNKTDVEELQSLFLQAARQKK